MNKFSDDEGFEEVFGKNGGKRGLRGFPRGLTGQMADGGMIMIAVGADGSGMPGLQNFGTPITGDEVKFHDGDDIIVPRSMTYERAGAIFRQLHEEAETTTSFDRKFNYRPDDGAYATLQVLRERYGMVLGQSLESFFGTMPAETRTIKVGPNQTMQVPWGLIAVPTRDDIKMRLCDRHPDPELGPVFELHVNAPKKYKDEVEAIFDAIEDYLKTKSIYRGHAVIGAHTLEFHDLSGFNPDQIVFSDEATELLDGTLWAVLRHTQALRDEGVPRKRAVLLYGPYGTGKTSAGLVTAQIAIENGWTFISARPGRDKVEDVLRTAELYAPAVVFVEDIDNEAATGEDDEVTRLLAAFDGANTKGREVIVVLTTNHLERIHKGMLRPGRFDAIIEIASLDRNGVERLIKAVIPANKLDSDVNYDTVYEAMEGFFPAFVREALDRAVTFAINRLKGQRGYMLTTQDLVGAAKSLQQQLKALHEASEGERVPTLDTALMDVVTRAAQHAVHGTKLLYAEDELVVPALNGKH